MGKRRISDGLRVMLAVLVFVMLFAIPVSAKSMPTKYKGTDYAKVYNYDYYMSWLKDNKPSVYNSLVKKSGSYVLKYFVNKGMRAKHQGNKAFNVTYYYNLNPHLRFSYGTDWAKYYKHFVKYGSGTVPVQTSIKDVLTEYKYSGKWYDLSGIYDFEYFTKHNASARKYWTNQDDAGAIRYFVNVAMLTRKPAKEGVTYKNSKQYQKYYKKFHPSKNGTLKADKKAQKYSSKTNYLILLDQNNHKVRIYKGKKGNWTRIKTFNCGVGKPTTPSPVGTFEIGYKGTVFLTAGNAYCWYYSQYSGNCLFHSVCYYRDSKPRRVIPGQPWGYLTHGCVRLQIQNAYYIYKNIPKKTKVVSYNRAF